jgi:hypothetical protein
LFVETVNFGLQFLVCFAQFGSGTCLQSQLGDFDCFRETIGDHPKDLTVCFQQREHFLGERSIRLGQVRIGFDSLLHVAAPKLVVLLRLSLLRFARFDLIKLSRVLFGLFGERGVFVETVEVRCL